MSSVAQRVGRIVPEKAGYHGRAVRRAQEWREDLAGVGQVLRVDSRLRAAGGRHGRALLLEHFAQCGGGLSPSNVCHPMNGGCGLLSYQIRRRRVAGPELRHDPATFGEGAPLEAMGLLAAITVGPATVHIIRHHERYGEAAINVCHCRQGFLDDVASDVLGTKLTQRVEEDRNVVLAHRVHVDER